MMFARKILFSPEFGAGDNCPFSAPCLGLLRLCFVVGDRSLTVAVVPDDGTQHTHTAALEVWFGVGSSANAWRLITAILTVGHAINGLF